MAEKIASEKALLIIAKIKAKQWKEMGKTVTQMREFTEANVIESFLEGIKEAWSLQVADALSPLKNEVRELVSTALEPIMPLITTVLNEATTWVGVAVNSWKAILTGQWDVFFKYMNANMSDDMKVLKNNVNKFLYDLSRGWQGFLSDIGKGWEGFWTDVGKGWSGFWRDTGLF